MQAFGDGWLERTEAGDPYERTDEAAAALGERMYWRPKPR